MSRRALLTIGMIIAVGGVFALLWINVVASGFLSIESSCVQLQEASPAPDGSWIAEQYYDNCSNRTKLVLRKTADGYARSVDVFLTTRPSDGNPIELLVKWVNDSELLIATPDEEKPSTLLADFRELQKPTNFKGVALRYEYYASNPDTSRDANSHTIIRKPTAFAYRFEKIKDLAGLPSVGCSLYLTALDGTYFDRLSVRLTANKTFSHRAIERSEGSWRNIVVPERSQSSILFSFHERNIHFTGEPTAAALDLLLPRGETITRDRNVKPMRVPAGGFAPARQLSWPINRDELATGLRAARGQTFDVKVGFWLENLEVVYSKAEQHDIRTLDDFQRCLSDNAIFAPTP